MKKNLFMMVFMTLLLGVSQNIMAQKVDYRQSQSRMLEPQQQVFVHPLVVDKNKEVVKGMSKQECLLAFGKPASVQKQGNKEEWMYDSYTYVFFENEIVTSLIK